VRLIISEETPLRSESTEAPEKQLAEAVYVAATITTKIKFTEGSYILGKST
jgi:hypothetical protein